MAEMVPTLFLVIVKRLTLTMKLSFKRHALKQKTSFQTWFTGHSAKKRIFLYLVGFCVLVAVIFGFAKVNNAYMVEVPASGGTLSEGLVGLPWYINPVLATTETDQEISALVYAGLFKHTASGGYEPELAKSYEVSKDGLTYTVDLRQGLTWQDGKAITADDVVFTVHMIQNERLDSPKYPNWRGASVTAKDNDTVVFKLGEPYGPFLENLTVGIIPKHIWEGKTVREFRYSKKNNYPIGAGPYRVEHIEHGADGSPTSYTLSAFPGYALGEPMIHNIVFRFYPNEKARVEALRDGEVESIAGVSSEVATSLKKEGFTVRTAPLLRTFAVFFNQDNNAIFTDEAARKALALATDKKAIVEKALRGYGRTLAGPLPTATTTEKQADAPTQAATIKKAKSILTEGGWTYDEKAGVYEKTINGTEEHLKLTLTTSKVPELMRTAEVLKQNWEALGADVTLRFLDIDTLNQNVIRTRDYEALLFGQVIGHNPDLYAFWHSSQKNDPGLNVGLFADIDADEVLEEARTITDVEKRKAKYQEFSKILDELHPAIFLYSPQFIYILPEYVHGVKLGAVTTASDRFFNITNWYLQTDHIWTFFLEKNSQNRK